MVHSLMISTDRQQEPRFFIYKLNDALHVYCTGVHIMVVDRWDVCLCVCVVSPCVCTVKHMQMCMFVHFKSN